MALTNKQSTLLELLNQMSQNLAADGKGVGGLPGIDLDIGIGSGSKPSPTPPVTTPPEPPVTTPPCIPCTPTTLREVLLSLVNEQVQVTTPFGAITGTLIAVQDDYIVIIETSGDQVLVRIDKTELISEL